MCWSPVSMVLVVFGRIDHRASFDANLLEQIPHFLVDVLLNERKFGFDISYVPQDKNWRYETWLLTLPVMTMQPSWSMISTSSWEGGWQNFCCRIWRMGSITLGVSRNATAMWPKARMVWSGIKWASLGTRGQLMHKDPCQIYLKVCVIWQHTHLSFSW